MTLIVGIFCTMVSTIQRNRIKSLWFSIVLLSMKTNLQKNNLTGVLCRFQQEFVAFLPSESPWRTQGFYLLICIFKIPWDSACAVKIIIVFHSVRKSKHFFAWFNVQKSIASQTKNTHWLQQGLSIQLSSTDRVTGPREGHQICRRGTIPGQRTSNTPKRVIQLLKGPPEREKLLLKSM